MSSRLDILWSPVHSDKFVTWGTELSLYQLETIQENEEIDASKSQLSSTRCANLLASSSELSYIKDVDIHPNVKDEVFLAVGQANGKVTLTAFGTTNPAFHTREYVPRHGRQCHAVEWSPEDASLLAVGLDKHRIDYGLLVWDSNVSSLPSEGRDSPATTYSAKSYCDMPKPLVETAHGETITSLAWLPNQSQTVIVGCNYKHLRIYDLRDGGRIQGSNPTKSVYGLQIESLSPYRLASIVDSTIAVWDLRNMDKPTCLLSQSKPVLKVQWCPYRSGLLGSLLRESTWVGLHDIQTSLSGSEGVEPTLLQRNFTLLHKPNISSFIVTSFAWSSNVNITFLAASSDGSLVEQTVSERISMTWSPACELMWTSGKNTICMMEYKQMDGLEDISEIMRERAINGYGLKRDVKENGELSNDESLKRLWNWLDFCGTEENSEFPTQYPGIRHILMIDRGSMDSEVDFIGFHDNRDDDSIQIALKVYRSDHRSHAIHVCGWGWGGDGESHFFFELLAKLESQGHFTRAAALAIFHCQLRRAIASLKLGATDNRQSGKANKTLGIVGMALSGYSTNKKSLWQEMCQWASSDLDDPYLKGLFAFLTAEGDDYHAVLNEEGMAVLDRLAFACVYLSDVRLKEFVNQLSAQLTSRGQVDGVIILGFDKKGMALLQRYIDKTGDIQSVCLIIVHALAKEAQTDDILKWWIECYRNLLDTWQLWHERCQLDILLLAHTKPRVVQPTQILSCNFCGKKIPTYVQGIAIAKAAKKTALNKLDPIPSTNCCPHCRKPLPRCSLCLLHMGTPAGTYWNIPPKLFTPEPIITPFGNWFTWCQSCRHGGHANHIMEWFKDHTECPVTGCTCRCESADSVSHYGTVGTTATDNTPVKPT